MNSTRVRREDWSTTNKLILLQSWAMDGYSSEQIATKMGIGKTTLYDWIKKDPNIANSLKIGKEQSVAMVENVLFQKATKEKDMTAIIFFLKNKAPNKWRDRQDQNINFGGGDIEINIKKEDSSDDKS